MIKSGQLATEAVGKRFHLKAQAAASFDHPNIVTVCKLGDRITGNRLAVTNSPRFRLTAGYAKKRYFQRNFVLINVEASAYGIEDMFCCLR